MRPMAAAGPSGDWEEAHMRVARASARGPRMLLAVLATGFGLSPPSHAAAVLHAAPPAPGAPRGDGSLDRPFRDLAQAVAVARALSERGAPEPGEGSPAGRKRAPANGTARAGATAAGSGGVTLLLAPGDYLLEPHAEVEPTCGNCADPGTSVPMTFGLRIGGRGIAIDGSDEGPAVIHTHAGYGLLFQDCSECRLRGVIVTDGARDSSGMATDAAVVVQHSSVTIEDCLLRDNIGDPAALEHTIVGISGIVGRDGGRLRVHGNRIIRHSWDGIALYRDAEAEITGNVIDGVDLTLGRGAGGGRGVGIGLTWNARATLRGNLVRRYWKGIGVFVDARATVEENIVEHVATWGLSLWDADQGRPQGFFRGNAVDSTGACGAMIARASPDPPEAGCLLENLFLRTGQNPKYDSGEPYCFQTAIARYAAPDGFPVAGNLFLGNREAGGATGSGDLERGIFLERARPLLARLAAWPSLRESRLLARLGSDAGPSGAGERPSDGRATER
jgi:hypothetical protein